MMITLILICLAIFSYIVNLLSNEYKIYIILLITLGYIIYYGWFFSKIFSIDYDLTTAYLSEAACERSPLEIETVRYTMKELYNTFPSTNTHHIVHAIFMGVCIILIITYLLDSFDGINVVGTLMICILMIWITYSVNDLSNNKVLKEYRTKYDQIKENLNTYFTTNSIKSISQFPEPFLKRLMVRYRAYHEATNYLKIPVYSDYEIRNELQSRMEETVSNSGQTEAGKIKTDELMRFMKFNYDAQGSTSINDIELLTGMKDSQLGTTYPHLYGLRGNTYDVKPSMEKQILNIKIILWLVMTFIVYRFFHMFYMNPSNRVTLTYGIVGLVSLTVVGLMIYYFTLT